MADTLADENGHKSFEDIKSTSIDNGNPQEETAAFELAGSKLLLVMIGLGLAIFLAAIDSSIFATAIPRITTQFHSIDDIGWYGSSYSFAMCSLQPVAGKLYASFSMKTVFLSYMAVFEFGSLICATAVNSPMLIVGRTIAGLGGAGITTGGMSIVASSMPLQKRGAFIGILHSTFGVATILGPLLGGLLTQHASWRWCFYINLPIGAVTFAFLLLFFHPPARTSDTTTVLRKLAKLDLMGAFLFAPSVVMILFALQWGGTQYAWKSATIIGLFLGGAGLLTVFALWQVHKGDNAMIPPRLMTQRTIFVACFINFFAMGAVMTSIFYLPEWFQVIKAVSPTKSGVMYLPLALSDILSATGAGVGVSVLGYANPFILAGTSLMSIGTGLITTFTPTTNHERWISYQVLQGLGAGMTLSMPYVATQTVLKGDDIPVGTSMVQLFQFLGSSVFLAISQALFTNQLRSSLSTLASVGIGRAEIEKILHAGATSVRKVVTEAQVSGVVGAYNDSIVSTFYVATAAAAASFVFSLGLEWRSVKAKP
ncbi:MFS general substrate transporter [Lophium mytilinum]|uniref:MFS general substrate transporter n=1 Tax=Lophium mytilinum TaxID=390894 RepID=A0A6A6QTH1_9PEZI|nr:MFS general substrate transporter [Lophium mytilinum]